MGFLLLLPFFLLRFGLLARLDRSALQRAARFAPMVGKERAAYWVYQLSTGAVILYPLCLGIQPAPVWLLVLAMAVYGAGLVLLTAACLHFARTDSTGLCRTGVYRWSRNPMYVAYFLVFLGCALATQSWVLLGMVAVFQVSAHWIILAEERACLAQFGPDYAQYMAQVRRYF